MQEDFLHRKLNERKSIDAFRELRYQDNKTDFSSNDYLGVVRNRLLEREFEALERKSREYFVHGSGGSRLLTGNYPLIEEVERMIAAFHEADAGLIFNSGYDANLGLLSSVPQRGDTVFYDQLSHASIRDGIRLSFAQAFSFEHNDLTDLEQKLQLATGHVFIVTESVFSMDGDLAPLEGLIALADKNGAHLIVDEAHATGVIGLSGGGLVQALGLQKKCFARVHTFGKAVGCHGAIVLGTETLRHFLINFSRAFIYTTALPPADVWAIRLAYALFPRLNREREELNGLIRFFHARADEWNKNDSEIRIMKSHTPVQGILVPGNEQARNCSRRLAAAGLDVRPILYPTVPKGLERLRVILHSYNTAEEIDRMMHNLTANIKAGPYEPA